MNRLFTLVICMVLLVFSNVFAASPVPKADLKGSKDSPLLGRYQGSLIISYDHRAFDEFTVPLSALEAVQDPKRRDNHNNRVFEPKNRKTVEGEHWRLVYLVPENVSPLEVVRNYQTEIRKKGGKILHECAENACGGDPGRSSGGGGGSMSLSMYLRPAEKVKDSYGSGGYCAHNSRISGQRFTAGTLDASGAYVTVLAYSIAPGPPSCRDLEGRTVAAVDIIRPKVREQKMVTIKAEEMAGRIAEAGSVALYGIYFDFNKADVKSESMPTLEQIARLMKAKPKLKLLVVGHTDNVGSFPFNRDLSQRRATAVVAALASRYRVDAKRLTPVGVANACPVASNKTEEGRAKNRRVELVEN
jgi:OOP family OmpA-OmpF porin